MDATLHLLQACRNKTRATHLDLQNADLTGANLSNLSADGLNLRAADLRRTTWQTARLGSCCLEGARIEDADWSGATLRMCVLDGAHGAAARFDGARIEDSSVKGADLTRANLRAAKLTETSFERSILRGAVLDDSEGDGVELRGADLRGATLIGARLDEADFRGADLREADLSGGRFHSADFRGALLAGVRWAGTDLCGAIFDAGAGPVQEAASSSDSAGSAPFDNEVETLGRWVEEFLKIRSRATAAASASPQSGHSRQDDDSGELLGLLKALGEVPASGDPHADRLSLFQDLLDVLEATPESEPNESWKPAIAQILERLRTEGQEPNLNEIFKILCEAVIQPSRAGTKTSGDNTVHSEASTDGESNRHSH